jgi:hypothetical protein
VESECFRYPGNPAACLILTTCTYLEQKDLLLSLVDDTWSAELAALCSSAAFHLGSIKSKSMKLLMHAVSSSHVAPRDNEESSVSQYCTRRYTKSCQLRRSLLFRSFFPSHLYQRRFFLFPFPFFPAAGFGGLSLGFFFSSTLSTTCVDRVRLCSAS